jgi:hypothetical protein
MAAVLKILIIRREVCRPSTWFHIAGDWRSWEVRRVTFKGFERVVSREVVDERILFVCSGFGAS